MYQDTPSHEYTPNSNYMPNSILLLILLHFREDLFRNLNIPWTKYLLRHFKTTLLSICSAPFTLVSYNIQYLIYCIPTGNIASPPFGIYEAGYPFFLSLFTSVRIKADPPLLFRVLTGDTFSVSSLFPSLILSLTCDLIIAYIAAS